MGAAGRWPDAVALNFIDCINHGDIDALGSLMTENHELRVFDEDAVRGKAGVSAAWRGYATAFPAYVIHPHVLAVSGNRVAVLGHSAGSHLGLTDEEESKLTLIWVASIEDGAVASWMLIADTPEQRRSLSLE